MQAVEVNLPGGMAIQDQWCRTAWLKPVTGFDEEFLVEQNGRLTPAARTTHLLSRCLERLGPVTQVIPEIVRQLSVGDREALMLHLRRITLGERVSCVLSCPSCEAKMDLDLRVAELLQAPYPYAGRTHSTEIHDGETAYYVSFRVPNGEDQEAVAELASKSITSAVETILRRCVTELTRADEPVDEFPPIVIEKVQEKMAELDPQAEIVFDLRCPECSARFTVPFDAADYVCRELMSAEQDFYREVHSLSFHYHWSEDAVLALPRRKRQIYVDVLADELSRGVHGA
jgi:hypothetical protein